MKTEKEMRHSSVFLLTEEIKKYVVTTPKQNQYCHYFLFLASSMMFTRRKRIIMLHRHRSDSHFHFSTRLYKSVVHRGGKQHFILYFSFTGKQRGKNTLDKLYKNVYSELRVIAPQPVHFATISFSILILLLPLSNKLHLYEYISLYYFRLLISFHARRSKPRDHKQKTNCT